MKVIVRDCRSGK